MSTPKNVEIIRRDETGIEIRIFTHTVAYVVAEQAYKKLVNGAWVTCDLTAGLKRITDENFKSWYADHQFRARRAAFMDANPGHITQRKRFSNAMARVGSHGGHYHGR